MTIDVLMPIYCTPVEWVREAIRSIRDQQDTETTLVIVDDNNPKGELKDLIYEEAVCKCLTKVVTRTINEGISAALNDGLKECTSDLIVRMDADDIARGNLLSEHRLYFTKHKDRHICGVQIHLFSQSRTWDSHHPEIVSLDMARKMPGFWFINHPGVAYRRQAIMDIGGYGSTPSHLAEDYALWIKFLRSGYTIYNNPNILLDYRVHPKNHTFSPDRKSLKWFEFLKQQKESLYD